MIIEAELRDQIARVMKGELSLDELYAWLMARSWNMHKDSNQSAIELASNLEALFFDRADGVITDEIALQELAKSLNNISESIEHPVAEVLFPRVLRFSGSKSATLKPVPLRLLPVAT